MSDWIEIEQIKPDGESLTWCFRKSDVLWISHGKKSGGHYVLICLCRGGEQFTQSVHSDIYEELKLKLGIIFYQPKKGEVDMGHIKTEVWK